MLRLRTIARSRIIFSAALTRAGFSVLVAVDGADGIDKARKTNPDVVLMDIAMPVLDGVAAVQRMKADAELRRIPVIAVTGQFSRHSRGDLADAGFDAVLLKPLDPGLVVAAARQAAALA